MSALTDTFTAIANAIRVKLGVSTTYTPAQMASAIASIPKAILQSKSTNVTPSANWSGTNTNYATITPDSGYDGMSQLQVSVPMLRDNTLMEADAISTPGTVYNGNTSQTNSQQLLRMHPTKDGMSYTGSYLFLKPNSYLGNASASDVLSGKTFSSSNGIQITGTGSSGGTVTKEVKDSWSFNTLNNITENINNMSLLDGYDWIKFTYQHSSSNNKTYSIIFPSSFVNYGTNSNKQTISFGIVDSDHYDWCRILFIWKDSASNKLLLGFSPCYKLATNSYDDTLALPRKLEGIKLTGIEL